MPQHPRRTRCVGGPCRERPAPAQRPRADLRESTGSARSFLWGDPMCQHILGPGSAAASCFPFFERTAYKEQAHPTSQHPNSGPERHSPLYQGFPAPSSIPSPNPSCRIVFRKASELRVLAQGMQEPSGKEKQILVDRHLPDLNTCTQKGCLLPQRTEAQLYIPVRSTDRQTSSQMASALRNRAEQKKTAQEKTRMR